MLENPSNLVSIHSEDEFDFVLGLNAEGSWIGGRREPGNREKWKWSDGTVWDYTNWYSGMPDDDGGNEDCTRMKANNHGRWNDRECSGSRTFVCKKGKITCSEELL